MLLLGRLVPYLSRLRAPENIPNECPTGASSLPRGLRLAFHLAQVPY